jgi:hypothetical protein
VQAIGVAAASGSAAEVKEQPKEEPGAADAAAGPAAAAEAPQPSTAADAMDAEGAGAEPGARHGSAVEEPGSTDGGQRDGAEEAAGRPDGSGAAEASEAGPSGRGGGGYGSFAPRPDVLAAVLSSGAAQGLRRHKDGPSARVARGSRSTWVTWLTCSRGSRSTWVTWLTCSRGSRSTWVTGRRPRRGRCRCMPMPMLRCQALCSPPPCQGSVPPSATGFDCCVLAAPKAHPTALLAAAWPLLAPSASFVVYGPWPQPLAEAHSHLQVWHLDEG